MTRQMLVFFVFVGIAKVGASASLPAECQPWPSVAPWQWSDAQRIEKRFDEACLAARRVQAANRERKDGSCTASGTITDFVFGTDTPELFLPWELFDTLLRKHMPPESTFAESQQRIFEQHLRSANITLPQNFWQTIESSAAEYIKTLRQQQQMASGLNAASPAERRKLVTDISDSQRANCALRAAALDRIRAAFAPSVFDQLLYVGVAPGICSSGSGDRGMKTWVSRGCPGARQR